MFVYFDFLLADKPIVFFDYDLEEYLRGSRKMYFEYAKFTPGQKAATAEEFEKALQRACRPDEEYQKWYRKFRTFVAEKVFDNREEIASLRLVSDIKTVIGGAWR